MSTPPPAAATAAIPGGESTVAPSPMIHGSMNWEPVRKRLLGPDEKDALQAAMELQGKCEIVHSTEFPLMLSALLPAFSSVLAHRTRPSADVTSLDHKLRNSVLEIISRFPTNEVLRPHAPHIVALAIDVLKRDYEDNALLASRIIFDLYKMYRSLPQDYVQPYLDFVQEAYRALPAAVQRNFDFQHLPPAAQAKETTSSPATAATATATTATAISTTTPPSTIVAPGTNTEMPPPSNTPAATGTAASSASPSSSAAAPTTASARSVNTNPATPAPTPAPIGDTGKDTVTAPAGNAATNAPTGVAGAASTAVTSPTIPDALPSTTGTVSSPTTGAKPPASTTTPSAAPTQAESTPPKATASKAEESTTPPSAGRTLATTSPGSVTSTMSPLQAQSPKPRLALRSNTSFRVLTECPLIVMLLFQLFPRFLKNNIPVLISVMMEALALRAPLMPPAAESATKRLYFSRSRELVAAQAKTLSFLTYLLRGFSSELKPYEDRLASYVVALMSTCPREPISTRKELLVATRHLLNSDFRSGFYRHIDVLLDERVLVGCNHRFSEQTILRPLAYTALSDLIHHVRSTLTMPQMSRVVCMFSRVLHDTSSTLPMSTQYTAARALLSVVDNIFHNKDPNPQIGRDLLARILNSLVNKLASLKEYFPQVQKAELADRDAESQSIPDQLGLASFNEDFHHAFFSDRSDSFRDKVSSEGNQDASDSVQDIKSMVRAIVVGHKTVIWYINNYRNDESREKVPMTAGSNEEVSSAMLKMTNSERALVDQYILLAIPCMQFLKEDPGSPTAVRSDKPSAPDQYRDVLSYFSAAFTALDGYDLKRTLGRRLDIIVDAIVDDSSLMLIPRHLLGSNATTSYEFCVILLSWLVERMDLLCASKPKDVRFFGPAPQNLREVEGPNVLVQNSLDAPTVNPNQATQRAAAYLQLFERVLKSLSAFPDNEGALRPHLQRIVATCLRSSMETAEMWPNNYSMLLRYVFRSISAGKFEESYKELLPLIPTVLNGLYRVVIATNSCLVRNTIVELCLTIPARLSSLLPHMNLLLRVIVRALESNSGDLVNLGLRTLEFWIDNLNPDFLYPQISNQTALFTELMQALSCHLRPAPYQYGLLTLRLLGKLGGKNRLFLRHSIDFATDSELETDRMKSVLAIKSSWPVPTMGAPSGDRSDQWETPLSGEFFLPLPIDRCVALLNQIASLERSKKAQAQPQPQNDGRGVSRIPCVDQPLEDGKQIEWNGSERLWSSRIEEVDLVSYCTSVMEDTCHTQAMAAFHVVRAALAAVVSVDDKVDSTAQVKEEVGASQSDQENQPGAGLRNSRLALKSNGKDFKLICLGLMYSCVIVDTMDEACTLLNGLASHFFFLVVSHHRSFVRIDANGVPIEDNFCFEKTSDSPAVENTSEAPSSTEQSRDEKKSGHKGASEKLGSLKPFGYFQISDSFTEVDPFVFNQAIAEFLAEPSTQAREVGLELLRHLTVHAKQNQSEARSMDMDTAPVGGSGPLRLHRGASILFENLLSRLCLACLSNEWNKREGLLEGIYLLLEELGKDWGLKYECEIMNTTLSVMKSVPRELSTAVVKSLKFFVRVCSALYGHPSLANSSDGLVWDSLAVKMERYPKDSKEESTSNMTALNSGARAPSSVVCNIFLTELASAKQIVRIAARYFFTHFLAERSRKDFEEFLVNHLSSIRRIIFSRSLRLLPLPEQVGAVEALAFVVKEAKNVLPITDQHLLAFLSELLKMSSVADGEMSDSALVGCVVDKNGYTSKPRKNSTIGLASCVYPSHSSALFYRRECVLETQDSKYVVPEELPHGVQLRVSSISLLHSVICGHPDAFFDAEVSTPIGNIRPHVISLLFRSLVSSPVKAVIAAHEALREVLSLSVVAKESSEKSKSQSRLPKELLQTCIRPVLLNLRDYTRLSVPLLRGLSRLLNLLSSWFNKTLGEKLLDHLQKWTDPGLIKSHKIWKEGEEPNVAAAIIDLFSLLPHASHFVESLVKTTIKLEAYLPGFNPRSCVSPYRRPLARYLNKHPNHCTMFFFPRLKAPLYSELFQDIITLDESDALRTHLSGRQCSVMILNACFERPLAIIRSEKSTSSGTSPQGKSPGSTGTGQHGDLFALHGIQSESQAQRGAAMRLDIETKEKRLQNFQQEVSKTQDALAKAVASTQSGILGAEEEAKKKHALAKAALDKATKDLNEAKQALGAHLSQASAPQSAANVDPSAASNPRPMNTESLELQHQGFMLVKALISQDEKYLQEHNDVVRAFRWLWRSKGRYMRLQHEDSVSPRFHGESKMLVTFLMNYAKAFPNDVDVLFELIRIFLQPATTDYSFVRRFLAENIARLETANKKQIIQRFFSLMSGESTEETKALSIQLLLYPLLASVFKAAQSSDDGKMEVPGPKSTSDYDVKSFIDAATAKKFVKEVLFENGNPTNCEEKLKVELLKVTDLILQYAPSTFDEFHKELIRFFWSSCKSEDSYCKSWAYVVLCRFISVFQTPAKIILQVYSALIRSHQQEGRQLVRLALGLLIPALGTRLSAGEFRKAIDFTNRIMFEEGNSVPQLAHLWHTIVMNPDFYYPHCHQFVPRHMVNSLNRLGLPPNCPAENRALTVSMIGMLLEWKERRRNSTDRTKDADPALLSVKRRADREGETQATKKLKDNAGAAVEVPNRLNDTSVILDGSMVDTIANFIVRLKVLIADPKVDPGSPNLDSVLVEMFRKVASTWKHCSVRPVYFEKIASLCIEESTSTAHGKPPVTVRSASPKAQASPGPVKKSESSKPVTSNMLRACLDIFLVLAQESPGNDFLAKNALQLRAILASCFRHVGSQSDDLLVRVKLKIFILRLYETNSKKPYLDEDILLMINAHLENVLGEAVNNLNKGSSSDGRSSASRGKEKPESSEDKDGDMSIIMFALEIIEGVCEYRSDYFMAFSSLLLALAGTLVKRHLAESSAKQRHKVATQPQSGGGTAVIPQMHSTPVAGIMDELCSHDPGYTMASGISKSSSTKQGFQGSASIKLSLHTRALLIVLRLVGSSNVPFAFTEDRKCLFQILGSILDTSDNVPLLLTVVEVVGKWLLKGPLGGPFTLKERNSFLWKIASFDFLNGVPDVESQPLAGLVAETAVSLGTMEKENARRASDGDDMIIGRSLVACLLNANSPTRSKLIELYADQGRESATDQGTMAVSDTDGNSPRTSFDVLWLLLHSDFEGLGGRNWIVVFVELLLASIESHDGVCLASISISGTRQRGSDELSWLPFPRWNSTDSKPGDPAHGRGDYKAFCEIITNQKASGQKGLLQCVKALGQLAHGDEVICNYLFEALLPASWDQVPNDAMRLSLVPALESLLSRPFHSQFLKRNKCWAQDPMSRHANVLRSFLNAVLTMRPLPLLDATVLVTLAENYNCWYEVLALLEQQYAVFAAEETQKQELAGASLAAMRHCYRQLNESNLWTGLACESCNLSESKWAASMDLYGMVSEASQAYSLLVEAAEAGDAVVQNASEFEMGMWEERWVDLQREMCQLEVVKEYANISENPHLLLECAWKSRDWTKVRSLIGSVPLIAAVEAGDPSIKMCETLLAVADGKLNDVENLHAQTAQLCLYKWQQLPKLTTGSLSHASMLHFFHRLVEIRESGQIMVETGNHSKGRTLPDLKNLLNAWRHRLPNDYEKLTLWDDVFTWRAHMFSAVASNFNFLDNDILATLHDRPWSSIRIAKTARKQDMREVSLLLLSKLTDNRIDLTDAFLKLREQIISYNNPDSDLERTGGLNLINTTNLSYFDSNQTSELFRLKAVFLASLGLRSKSNQAYCHSVQICPTHARAWVSWGGLCANLGALTEKQMEQAVAKGGAEASKETKANTAKKVAQYLAQSMGCYFEAIQLDAHEWARIHLPKCLLMLIKDGSSPGVLCQTLENRGSALPAWVWLPWIPQLLTGLCRIEGRAAKAIISRLVKSYPQAVYFALRAFYLERRDVERSKGQSHGQGHMGSVAHAEEMMSTLRRSHASLWSSLESILEELIVKFRPSYEEELLATITALLERADAQSGGSAGTEKGKADEEDAMVASVSKTLGRIAVKFFKTLDTSSTRNDERARKTAEFKQKYKAEFESDFRVSASEKEQTELGPLLALAEYVALLKRWRSKLERQVASTPPALPLMESSHSLSLFNSEAPDLWPGSCDPRSAMPSKSDRTQTVFETDSRTSQSSTSASAAAAHKAATTAATAATAAAAQEGVGGEYGGGSACIEIPGQYVFNSCSSSDVKPCPELHAKLVQFQPHVEVIRRNDQLIRRIGMVGSDGKTYRFLLQFAIPYWTRTDERAAQTHYVLDKILRKDVASMRQHLSVQPTAVIPVAQRLRMTLDLESRTSLDDVFKQSCESTGLDANCFLDMWNKQLNGDSKTDAGQEGHEARLEAFRKIRREADESFLLRHMSLALGSPELLFQFRRVFAAQLATNSLLQYAFAVADRTPSRLVFLPSNGSVLSPEFRVSYTNQGFIDSRALPFRLTPNLEKIMGVAFQSGRFIPSMSAIAEVVRDYKEEMDPILRLLMRDDIVAWYCKSMAKSDSKLQELERQLADRVSKNVASIQAKFSECAPRKDQDKQIKNSPVDQRVRELVAAASSADNLCMMNPTYQGWL